MFVPNAYPYFWVGTAASQAPTAPDRPPTIETPILFPSSTMTPLKVLVVSVGFCVKLLTAAELPAVVTLSISIFLQFELTQIPCRTLPPAVQFDRWTPSIGLPGRPLRFSPAPALLENQESENCTFCTLPVLAPKATRAPSSPQVSHSKLWMNELTAVWPGPGKILEGILRVIDYIGVGYRQAAGVEYSDAVASGTVSTRFKI